MLSSITLGLVQPQGQSAIARLFANNEPGFDYDPTDFNRTTTWRRNQLTWSEQFDNAAWVKVAQGVAVLPAVTANAGVAPDGTLTADRVQFDCGDAGGVANRSYIGPTAGNSITAGVQYVGSIWVRAFDGANVGRTIRFSTDSVGTGVYTLTASWQRISFTGVATNTTLSNFLIETRGTFTTQTADVLLWGAQFERGSVATDYQRITDFTSDFRAAFPDTLFYADTAGTTPVTAVEQTVALILDKSRGLRANSVLGPIDQFTFNGAGTTPPTATSGAATFLGQPCVSVTFPTVASGGFAVSRADSSAGAGAWNIALDYYRVTYSIALSRALTGGEDILVYSTGSWGIGRVTLNASNSPTTWTTFVRTEMSGLAGIDYLAVVANVTTSPVTVYVRQYTVERINGLHQLQSTPGSRAVLRSRYNLLTWSEDFTNAAWSKSFTGVGVAPIVTANAGIAPDGTLTANRIQFNCVDTSTNTNRSWVSQQSTIPAAETGRGHLWLKAWDAGNVGRTVRFTVESTGQQVIHTLTADWVRLELTGTTGAIVNFLFETRGQNTTQTADALVWGASVTRACDAQIPYQLIRSATDYAVGPQWPTYLEYDGVDDSYASAANLDLSGTDKVTVFAAVTKLSDAATTVLIVGTGTGVGTFEMFAPRGGTGQPYAFSHRTTTVQEAITSTGLAPDTAVLTGTSDIGAPLVALRRNGTLLISNNTALAAGNFGSFTLGLGSRGASLYFRGRMYRVIGRGAATATPLITAVEQQLNGQVGRVY